MSAFKTSGVASSCPHSSCQSLRRRDGGIKTSTVASSCPHSSRPQSLRRRDGGIKTISVTSRCPHSSRRLSLRRRDGGVEDIRCCIVLSTLHSEIESVVVSGEEMAALRHPVFRRPVHTPVGDRFSRRLSLMRRDGGVEDFQCCIVLSAL